MAVRQYLCIDQKSFYATVECVARGLDPMTTDLVVADPERSENTICLAVSPSLKSKGVSNRCRIKEIPKYLKYIVATPRMQLYIDCAAEIYGVFLKYVAPEDIHVYSIDECFMDVTEIIKQYKRPLDLAFQIQQSVLNETGLSVSIGVAPNRFLAKMASDMRKPAGITVLRISELETKLWPLDISLMYGIGKKTVPELKKIGIQTIGDFASAENETKILQLMKNSGYALIQKARGHSSSQLHYSYTQKSCSVSKTYSSNIYTLKEAFDKVKELSIELSNRLKKDNQKGKLISISLRDLNFHTIVRSQSLNQYTNQPQIIYEIATNLIESNFESNGYRYMALTMASLQNANQIVDQISLFEIPIQDSKTIIEQLNHELKKDVLFRASDLLIKESK